MQGESLAAGEARDAVSSNLLQASKREPLIILASQQNTASVSARTVLY